MEWDWKPPGMLVCLTGYVGPHHCRYCRSVRPAYFMGKSDVVPDGSVQNRKDQFFQSGSLAAGFVEVVVLLKYGAATLLQEQVALGEHPVIATRMCMVVNQASVNCACRAHAAKA
jgi:hypothetical protein